MITVPEVLKAMGLEVTSELSWSVGARAREQWERDHDGDPPPKELRRKTSGEGSHCFATYPESFRSTIEAIAHAQRADDAKQMRFDL